MSRIQTAMLCTLVLMAGGSAPSEETAAGGVSGATEERDAVTRAVLQLDTAINTGDMDRFMALFAEGAVELPPEERAVIGKDAIRARDGAFLEKHNDVIKTVIEDIQVSGEWSFVRTSYTESWTPKAGGETTTVKGKSVFILRRQTDGAWRISTLIWNTDGK